MARQQTPGQRQTVKRVMHEFKHGELKTARGARKVKNPKQAIAIALSEAGASKYDTPKERTHNLRRTKQKERRGETGQAAAEGRSAAARTMAAQSRPATKTARRSPAADTRGKSATSTRSKSASAGRSKTATKSTARKTATKSTARKSAAASTARKSTAASSARKSTARSGARKAAGDKTRTELYAEASRRKIPGRSKMSKQQLERALRA